jgi:hypothetical protein
MWYQERRGTCGGFEPHATKPCGRPAQKLVLVRTKDGGDAAALGRVEARCFCDAHGGIEAAKAGLMASWSYLAPSNVADVTEAGTMDLDSRAQCVVIRDAGGEDTPQLYRVYATTREQRANLPESMVPVLRQHRLQAPYTTTVRSQAEAFAERVESILGWVPPIEVIPPQHRERARWSVALGLGNYTQWVGAYESRELATSFGLSRWREHVRQAVRDIRRARGGTLEWGMPLHVPDMPDFVFPARGQSAWDAWVIMKKPHGRGMKDE